jgi:hypothetical protein
VTGRGQRRRHRPARPAARGAERVLRLAALTDGTATIRGVEHRWSTVGLYDVIDDQIAACWLLPLDPRAFDAIWSA